MTKRFTAPLQARRGDPKGQVLVLFALMLVVLLLVSALAVDYGGWLVARRGYQNYADAAALAGAHQLTRPLTVDVSNPGCVDFVAKNDCAEEAAWESLAEQLDLTLSASALAAGPATTGVVFGDYTIWVASPPSAAGSAFLGRVSGPGNVYVRVDHPGATYLSRIAGIGRTITGWATAGRFPANFAVIGMCSPTSVTERCLAGDANIKLDGTNTNLIVETGDIGTNRWIRGGGVSSGAALGTDSNAYMQSYDTCWSANQCQLWGYDSPNVDTTDVRSAIPLGAPIQNPNYPLPTIGATTTPNQCRGTVSPNIAMAPAGPAVPATAVQNLPIRLASVVLPKPALRPASAVATTNDIEGFVKATVGGAALNGITVVLDNGAGTIYTLTTAGGGPNAGKYSMNNVQSGTYTVTATDNNAQTNGQSPATVGTYHSATASPSPIISAVSSNSLTTVAQINMQKNPILTGTIRDASTNAVIPNASISVVGTGSYTTTANASGVYTIVVAAAGNYTITASKAGYVDNSTPGFFINLDQTTGVGGIQSGNINLTPSPGSLDVNVTDQITGLAIPHVTVTLSGANSGNATTGASGSVNFPVVNQGSTTITLSAEPGYDLSGYVMASPSNLPSPSTVTMGPGLNTSNFQLWPRGCGTANGDKGDWNCSNPSGSCPAPTNTSAANVNCTFTQNNAIRPGTYVDITLPNGTCAWLDPKGGLTGLASGQSGGIYHIKGTLSIGNNSYLFGDGITLVFDQGANIDVGNGGGFVLNYGSLHSTPSDPASACDYSTAKAYKDGYYACFRTVDNTTCAATPNATNCPDYAYAAWTSLGKLLWSGTTSPTYSDLAVAKGSELGITFFFYCPSNNTECGLGNASRMKLATANMGYLFNGVLYGPGDDIQLGGGKDGQTAAGQIVGWTIEYHGGTAIKQNWYGDPVDGQPFLIEPVLGE
jgi:hypothetical protein